MKYLIKVEKINDEKTYTVKQKTDAKHKPRVGEYIFIESETDLNHPIVSTDIDGNLSLVEDPAKLVEKQVTDEYALLVTDVYDEMYNTFGTRNDVSASAFAATYEAMLARPHKYVDPEMGLTTEAEVTAYAETKVAGADAYGKYRLKRIAEYKAKKAVILGE